MGTDNLNAFFNPAGVAVIGASDNPGKLGYTILKNLRDAGFTGALHPINPKSESILGLDCYKSIKDVPGPLDLAVVIIPAKMVPQAVRECGERGVRGAVVISGGFSEAGREGEELQKTLAGVAAEYGVRVIGPNCQGVNNPYGPLCASWPLLTRKGRIAVVSQSGTVGAAMMDWFSVEELGVSSFVSLGNRADVDEIDLIEYFEQDPNTQVIAAYIEGIKDPERFQKVLETRKKPLVVLKSGRTPRGRVAAESHTKSLAGSDAIYSSLLKRHGVCRADTIEEFYDFAKAYAYLKPPPGNRILFVTTSGGAAILATDAAEQEGIETSPLPKELADSLEGVIPAHAIRSNPLDLTGDANASMFKEVMDRARPYYDTLGVIFGDPIVDASKIVTPNADELIIYLGGAEVERMEKQEMHRKGIPVYPTPERGIRALSQVISKDKKGGRAHFTFPTGSGRSQVGINESFEFLESRGFECISSRPADSEGKAVNLAHKMGFPVVLKIDSPDILHKSDCGGVKVNIQTAQQLRTAYSKMMEEVSAAYPNARISGVAVSAMAAPGLELLLGMHRDPQFGPVIMFGLGGVAVELFRDVTMRVAPITRTDAFEMLDEIRGAQLLKGFRGQPAINRNAVADAIMRLGDIARDYPDIAEIDLNPVRAYSEGIVVIDARIIKA